MPNLGLVTDVALDPYTSHGHDILRGERILNDGTVFVLWEQALNEARTGGRRRRPFRRDRRPRRRDPRRTRRGKSEKVQILSYAAKYASTFYGLSAMPSAPMRHLPATSAPIKLSRLSTDIA